MNNDDPLPGRVGGIDFGTVRVGIAISDPTRMIASPLETYTRRNKNLDEKYFCELVSLERITQWVVGLPLHMSGDESEKSRQAREYGAWIFETTGIAVDYVDERFSSRQADEMLRAGSMSRKASKRRRDMLAAQVILSIYLESGPMATAQQRPLED